MSTAAEEKSPGRFRILPGLNRHNWGRETLSGVTLAAIAVPLNIGYAQIAGLPATAGLYALILPCIVFALVVSSRQLIASPDAAAAALVASSIGGLAAAGSKDYLQLALAQAMICAAIFAIFAVFKLGFLANFLSEPILIGFVGGLALDIFVSQIAKMLGVKVNSGDDFIPRFGELLNGLPHMNAWSLVIAVGSVLVLVLGRRIASRVPWALVVLVVATVVLVLTGLQKAGVDVLGHVDAGPPALTWPVIGWDKWVQLIPSAGALVLVTVAEGLLIARKYAELHGYAESANRDLWAFAGSNAAASVTGGFTIGSSASRTAAMDQAGTRTQLPPLVTAVITLLLLIFGTALLEDIPSPAIGAIVGIAVLPLIGISDFVRLWKQRKFEFVIGAVCFLGSLLLGPVIGIIIAFVLSLINMARRAAQPAVDVLAENDNPAYALRSAAPDAPLTAPGVIVLRFAAPLFFANATEFDQSVRAAVTRGLGHELKHLVLDCEAITDLDVTAAGLVGETVAWVRSQNVTFAFSRVRSSLKADLEHFDLLGGATIYDTNRAAVAALRSSAP